ncbi:hypothetical protein EYB25_007293 [Talaromyces marneffei]|nr:hypothetical protein EYB25_007293 [Talaromyces marneffei]
MPDDRGFIYCTRGVTPELWKTLDELWGSDLAGPLRKLRLVRNHKGPYKVCTNPPESIDLKNTRHNDHIHLFEIRYGIINSMYDGQPCLWFVLKHAKDDHNQISGWSHLKLRVQFWKKKDGKEDRHKLIDDNIPVQISRATHQGDDLYALLAMIVNDPNEWNNEVLPRLSSYRIGDGERVVVQLTDSQPASGRFREAIWQGDINWT